MTMVSWQPNDYLKSWKKEMNEMFNTSLLDRPLGRRVQAFSPVVDIRELKAAYQINLELPGIDKHDISIELNAGVLIVKGEKKRGNFSEKEELLHYERVYGTFTRSFEVHNSIKVDQIKASYSNGILTVHLPKAEDVQPKKIEIQ